MWNVQRSEREGIDDLILENECLSEVDAGEGESIGRIQQHGGCEKSSNQSGAEDKNEIV